MQELMFHAGVKGMTSEASSFLVLNIIVVIIVTAGQELRSPSKLLIINFYPVV